MCLCRGSRDAPVKEHVGRELNSGYMGVVMEPKWWHGAANCSSPATFQAGASQFVSLEEIRGSEQASMRLCHPRSPLVWLHAWLEQAPDSARHRRVQQRGTTEPWVLTAQVQLCTRVKQVPAMPRMESWCHLFARKFRADSVDHLLRIYLNESTAKVNWA